MSSLRNNFVYLMLFKLLLVFKFINKRGLGFFINEDNVKNLEYDMV